MGPAGRRSRDVLRRAGPRGLSTGIVRATVAITIILGFVALGVLAALSAAAPGGIAFVEVAASATIVCVVLSELRPALAERRAARATWELAIRDLRRALDALPETEHPLGL